jgi:alpha-L-fucosidase
MKTLATNGELKKQIKNITLLGSDEKLNWNRSTKGLTIQLPQHMPTKIVNGFKITFK